MKITLIGIGQPLRGDDEIGPEAVRQWVRDHPTSAADPNLKILFAETPGLDLLELFEDSDAAILVDAVQTGASAGTVSVHASLPEIGMTPAEKSAHGLGVVETFALAKKIGARLPPQIRLIGVEGSRWGMGESLSDPVRCALPDAVRAIEDQILEWASG